MNTFKRFVVGAASAALALSSVATPAFAAASAWNKNIDGHSFASAKAEDNDTYNLEVENEDTYVFNATVSLNNSGLNNQSGNKNGNKLKTGGNWSLAKTENNVNTTVIHF